MRYLIYLFILCLPLSLQAGPWPKAKGEGYFKLYEWWLRFDEHYTTNGELDPNATLGLYNTTAYGEYGITDRLTGVANIVLLSRNTINDQISGTRGNVLVEGDAINGIGDSEIGFRYALTKPGARTPISIGLLLGIPLGEDAGGAQGNLQTGDGEFNQLLNVGIGRSFQVGGVNGFAAASLGYNNRTNGFSDEVRFGAEAGLNLLNKKLWIIGRVNGSESTFNGETAASAQTTSIFSNNAEYLSVGGELNYNLTDRVGISAGVAGAVSGRIIAAAPAYTVGVYVNTGGR
ncbi:hypothetical protein [Lewinella sp. 4G2]|uniref:hypothetical protein n=1 Tax=Lewinella sp. 4G2 TaxID=1803372 RepID=UPI0007B48880|nr:hypothetical protein [Lewinella sp. 4G2]OAV45495.1 hypothetical protein A3850_013795 [Lewinella sp. 4G2]